MTQRDAKSRLVNISPGLKKRKGGVVAHKTAVEMQQPEQEPAMSDDEGEEPRAPLDGARRAGAEARSLPARRSFSSPAFQASKKIRELLSRRIEDSSFTQRDLEQQLGFAKGYLSRMLRGCRKLEVGELFALLDVVGLQAGPFLRRSCSQAFAVGRERIPAQPFASGSRRIGGTRVARLPNRKRLYSSLGYLAPVD